MPRARGNANGEILILHAAVSDDALPDEQDVLTEVNEVSEALNKLGYRTASLALTLDLQSARNYLVRIRPWMIFNLVEGLAGSGRLIHLLPALLEDLGLRYTGSPLESLFTSSNKLLAKRILALRGIATPDILELSRMNTSICSEYLWIVKSVWEHASIGLDEASVAPVDKIADRISAKQKQYGGDWFAERYIEGREFNLALLAADSGEPEVLPPAEIRFRQYQQGKPRIVDYRAKWITESYEYRHTERSFVIDSSDQPLISAMKKIALQCWALFECRGYARVDFRVDDAGIPWVLEVNTNPCLSADAGFAAAARHAGIAYQTIISRILSAALIRDEQHHPAPHNMTGSNVSYS